MTYALCALVGAFLFGAGYWVGQRYKTTVQAAPEAEPIQDDVDRKYNGINQQVINMMNYNGRPQNED